MKITSKNYFPHTSLSEYESRTNQSPYITFDYQTRNHNIISPYAYSNTHKKPTSDYTIPPNAPTYTHHKRYTTSAKLEHFKSDILSDHKSTDTKIQARNSLIFAYAANTNQGIVRSSNYSERTTKIESPLFSTSSSRPIKCTLCGQRHPSLEYMMDTAEHPALTF
jgi:hypothetical protein